MATSHAIIVVYMVLLVFFFSGIFAIYFYKCFLQNVLQTRRSERSSSRSDIVAVNPADAENPGLDPQVLNIFPTFAYSVVKQYRKPKSGRDCAICLLEFQEDHILRLITICTHVFHQKCVDIWFKMHKTCPACRKKLELPADESSLPPDLDGDSVSLTIKDDDHEQKKKKKKSLFRSKSRDTYEDRFTLELPDHVTEELLRRNHSPKHLDKSGYPYGHGQGSDGNV